MLDSRKVDVNTANIVRCLVVKSACTSLPISNKNCVSGTAKWRHTRRRRRTAEVQCYRGHVAVARVQPSTKVEFIVDSKNQLPRAATSIGWVDDKCCPVRVVVKRFNDKEIFDSHVKTVITVLRALACNSKAAEPL